MAIGKYFFSKLSRVLSSRGIYLTKSLIYRNKAQALPPNSDYNRYAILGLCYEEIMQNNLTGNIAELGVYKGEFAKRLNTLFPAKKLYLFDTFEGFDERDIKAEHKRNLSKADQDFNVTSVELVRSKMPYPDNCIFCKGYFPESATGIEDIFCFVSLDADLYEPIYQGLKFFYPRLENKGYIFIHDFNNDQYPGARKAVTDYCSENNIGYTPIADSGGTVIITK